MKRVGANSVGFITSGTDFVLHGVAQYHSDRGLARSSVYFPAMQSVKVWQRIHCKKKEKKKRKKRKSFLSIIYGVCVV